MENNSFVIRVYGIYTDEDNRVLVSDEFVYGREMTKFPGGGLEYGEGLRDCLKRELFEETGLDFEVNDHFYTTDFFISSLFHNQKQLICVYYQVKPKDLVSIKTSNVKFDFPAKIDGAQSFRWVEIKRLKPLDFTFPIDQHVATLLADKYR